MRLRYSVLRLIRAGSLQHLDNIAGDITPFRSTFRIRYGDWSKGHKLMRLYAPERGAPFIYNHYYIPLWRKCSLYPAIMLQKLYSVGGSHGNFLRRELLGLVK